MTAPKSQKPGLAGVENIVDRLSQSDMLNKLTEFFSESDPKLDRLKESILDDLEDLKKSPELTSLAINMWKSAEKGLRKDLKELNVSDEQTEAIVKEAKEKFEYSMGKEQFAEIMKSPEKKALDKYISDLENLPVLAGIIQSAEPKKNWEVLWEGLKKKKIGRAHV